MCDKVWYKVWQGSAALSLPGSARVGRGRSAGVRQGLKKGSISIYSIFDVTDRQTFGYCSPRVREVAHLTWHAFLACQEDSKMVWHAILACREVCFAPDIRRNLHEKSRLVIGLWLNFAQNARFLTANGNEIFEFQLFTSACTCNALVHWELHKLQRLHLYYSSQVLISRNFFNCQS